MVYIAQTGEKGMMCYKIWKAGDALFYICVYLLLKPCKSVSTVTAIQVSMDVAEALPSVSIRTRTTIVSMLLLGHFFCVNIKLPLLPNVTYPNFPARQKCSIFPKSTRTYPTFASFLPSVNPQARGQTHFLPYCLIHVNTLPILLFANDALTQTVTQVPSSAKLHIIYFT